ncbi:prephenate dehydrogenase [Aquirufa sp. ROCK-SH2]
MESNQVVGILGIGLIGGSMALDLKNSQWAKKCIGIDTGRKNQKRALELGLIDELLPLEEALKEISLLILAVPVDNLVAELPSILDKLNENQVVIEVGSTKTPVFESIKNHPKRDFFVSTHPMAGTEFSGPEAAIEKLFQNKRAVICDRELSNPKAIQLVENMYQNGLGMNLIYMDSISHDVHTAYISHISHICSFALASTVLEKEKDEKRIFELASTGFESTVRLAKSSPETWIQIFHQNQENLLDVLDEYINTLLKYKGLLLAGSYDKLKEELEKANEIKRVLNPK